VSKSNHYEVLGVQIGATSEAIRLQYRRLVRQLHPDVNPAPDAKERFIQIQEAYQVLSDPERRKHYDALLSMERQKQAEQQRQAERRRSGTPPSSSTRASTSAPTSSSTHRTSTQAAQEVQHLIQQAELAFVQGRLRDALIHARQITRLQPRHPKGHILLGDIYRVQGQTEAAISAYTVALQLDPSNRALQQKFERLAGGTPISNRTSNPEFRTSNSEFRTYAAQSIGWTCVIFILMLAYLFPGEPIVAFQTALPMISQWSANLILMLLLNGLLAGVMLSASGWVAPLEDSLPWRMQKKGVSAGLVLVLFCALCFPVAALIYSLLGMLQQAFNYSISRAFAATGILAAGFALFYPHDLVQTLALGGNLIFVGLICGWVLADAFRNT
jgi:curved DNA-binding protein CbpA